MVINITLKTKITWQDVKHHRSLLTLILDSSVWNSCSLNGIRNTCCTLEAATFLATKFFTTGSRNHIFCYMPSSKMVMFYSARRQQSGPWSFIRLTFYVQDRPLMLRNKHKFLYLILSILDLIAGLVPRTSSGLATGRLPSWLWSWAGSFWTYISCFFPPGPAIYPIVYSFNNVQIVNKIVYTMNISE